MVLFSLIALFAIFIIILFIFIYLNYELLSTTSPPQPWHLKYALHVT